MNEYPVDALILFVSIDGNAMFSSKILMLIRKILMVRISEISITIYVISIILDGTVGISFLA